MSDTMSKAKSLIFRNEGKTTKQMTHAISKAKSLITRKETVEEEQQYEDKGYRSKLVICIDILCSLVANGPMRFTPLSHKVELDTIRLIPHLKLLIDRELIEQQTWSEDDILYAITERGLKVLKVVHPIVKEAHKLQIRNFELISSTLSEAGIS
jgi:predicted transcriptional regulator